MTHCHNFKYYFLIGFNSAKTNNNSVFTLNENQVKKLQDVQPKLKIRVVFICSTIMNKELIEKFLQINGGSCPVFQYENPLIDKDVANLFAKSVVNLINDKRVNSNLQQLIMLYVKNTCKNEPANHLGIDDNITDILKDSYENLLKDINSKKIDTDKALDTFLIRNLKEVNICSVYLPSIKVEIIKALSNLKGSKKEMRDVLLKDIIYSKVDESNQYSDILKCLKHPDSYFDDEPEPDDISIKNKPEIEKVLLTCCRELFETVIDLEAEPVWEREDLKKLVQMCAISSECFQISCCILNSLFISTNFDQEIHKFIEIFVHSVKHVPCTKSMSLQDVYFSVKYPPNLRHIVVLLDVDVKRLPQSEQESYTQSTLKYLLSLRNESESDLIMLLSHFKEWFKIYSDFMLRNPERVQNLD